MRQSETLKFNLQSVPGVTFTVTPAKVPQARKLQRAFAKIAGPVFAALAAGLDALSPATIAECLEGAEALDEISEIVYPLVTAEGATGLQGPQSLAVVADEIFCRRPTAELALLTRVVHWQIGDFLAPKEQGDLAASVSLFLPPTGAIGSSGG